MHTTHTLSTQFENFIVTFSENNQKEARASKVGKLNRWGHQTTFNNFDPELFLSKRNERIKGEQRLKERPSNDLANLGSIPREPYPDTITDAILCLQTGA